jgi:hypothetical protein
MQASPAAKPVANMSNLIQTLQTALVNQPHNTALKEAYSALLKNDLQGAMAALQPLGVQFGAAAGQRPVAMPNAGPGSQTSGGMAQAVSSAGMPPPAKKRTTEAAAAKEAAAAAGAGGAAAADDDTHPSFEDATDVTKIAGVNLDEEEELLNESSNLGSRVSGPVDSGPTPAQLFDATMLTKKLRSVLASHNMNVVISPRIIELLQEALFERVRGLLGDAISISRHRAEAIASPSVPQVNANGGSEATAPEQPLPRVVSSNLRNLVQTIEEDDKREFERKKREAEERKLQIIKSKDVPDATRQAVEQEAAASTASAALEGISRKRAPVAVAPGLAPGSAGGAAGAGAGGAAGPGAGGSAGSVNAPRQLLPQEVFNKQELQRLSWLLNKRNKKQPPLSAEEEREFARFIRKLQATRRITRRDFITLIERDPYLRSTRLCWELMLGMPIRMIVEASLHNSNSANPTGDSVAINGTSANNNGVGSSVPAVTASGSGGASVTVLE